MKQIEINYCGKPRQACNRLGAPVFNTFGEAEGFTDIRIYKETEWDKEEGLFTREDVVYSVGSFPG